MAATEEFLTKEQEMAIIDAISQAEKNTSGEIRVHIEKHSEKPPLERAQEVFFLLGMDKTQARNGVLFYVGVLDHTFAIIGDEGIDKAVEPDFWDCTKDIVISHFKNQQFQEGLVAGILRAGERLQHYFPFQDDDKDELTNEISKG